MNTKELNDKCHKLLDWMGKAPGELVHIEDAEKALGSSRGDWLTVFEHLIREKLVEPSGRGNTVIDLLPAGVDIAYKSGGYLGYVKQQQEEKDEENKRSKQTAADSRLSARVAFASLIVTVGIAIWQSYQNSDTASKIVLLEVRQRSLADSLKALYKAHNQPDTSGIKSSFTKPALPLKHR